MTAPPTIHACEICKAVWTTKHRVTRRTCSPKCLAELRRRARVGKPPPPRPEPNEDTLARALAYLRERFAAGRPTSVRILQRHMGYASPRAAAKLVARLRARGHLTPSGPLCLTDPPCPDSSTPASSPTSTERSPCST